MKRKYKVIISSTALGALLTTGVLATAISCGKQKTDKYANRIHFFKFDGKKYDTFKQAEKAQKQYIDDKLDKELNDSSNKVYAYKYKGKEYLTKKELFDVYRKDVKIQKVYFKNTGNIFNDVKKTHTLKDVQDKEVKAKSTIFTLNNKGFLNMDDAIDEYLKGPNGDKSGKVYSENFYDKNTKKFGKSGAILGINKVKLDNVGNEDGKVYVTKNNIKTTSTNHTTIIEQLKDLSLAEYTPKYKIINHSNEVSKYKKEFLKVISTLKKYTKEESWVEKITNSPVASENIAKITLPSGRAYTNTKLFLDETLFEGKNYKATSIKKMVDDSNTINDLNYLWNLMKSRTWNFQYDEDENYGDWILFKDLFNEDNIENYGLDKYVDGDGFNFERKFEVNGKWFNSKLEALKEVERTSEKQPISRVKNTFSEIKNIDLTSIEDLKVILKTKLEEALKKDVGSDSDRNNGLYISSTGLTSNSSLKSIETDSKLFVFDLLKLINKTQTIDKLKLIYNFIKDKTIEAQDNDETTDLELDTLKFIYDKKAFATKDEAFKEFALINHLKGAFLHSVGNFTQFSEIENRKNIEAAIKKSKIAFAADNTLPLFDYETGNAAPVKSVVGENTHIFAGTGDCTGNIYVKVKVTANNEIGGANSIVGKNYSKEQIEAELKKESTWKNPSTPNNVIKKTTTEEATKGSLKNILVGRVVVANDGKISPSDKVYFDGAVQNEELIEKSKTFVKSRTHNFMHVKNGVILNKKEFKKKMLNDLISTKFSQIDEINISKKEPKIFDDVELDPIIINGLSGTGSIEETITKNDLTGALDLTFNVKHSNGKIEDITNRINSAALQNGDIVMVTIKKGESFITRTIKITSLKIGLIDFFNSSDPNISASRKIVMDKIKEEIGGLLPKIGESFTQLSDAFKEYIGTKTALRKKTDKLKLAKEIFTSKDTIDNQVFDKIAESKDSIINILVEELYKNNIFLNSISKDGSKIKDGIKSEINDLLDIFKVIVDHTLEFLGNSIYWEKEWNKKENFVAKTSTLDSKITELISAKPINGSKESSDLKFLKKLKEDGNFFASKEEQKNSIFKTTNELMKDNSKEYEIYREAVKDKKGNIIKGEFIYHIIKDVNARKITNTFKKNFNYTEFKKHGTLDNFGIIKGKEADNLIGGILDRAKERQKKDWKNIDLKDISLKELYKKHVSDGKDASTHTSNKGIDFTNILPMIKSVLSGNSISNILSAAGEEGGKLLGVNGIENIPEMFNSFTNSGSDVLIGVENNMFALLTYLIGDKAQIVIDIKENTDGTLKLDNYYSPQIRVIDKANNDKITYRKDNLDKFFNRLKPFMDLVYEFLGAKGK